MQIGEVDWKLCNNTKVVFFLNTLYVHKKIAINWQAFALKGWLHFSGADGLMGTLIRGQSESVQRAMQHSR